MTSNSPTWQFLIWLVYSHLNLNFLRNYSSHYLVQNDYKKSKIKLKSHELNRRLDMGGGGRDEGEWRYVVGIKMKCIEWYEDIINTK